MALRINHNITALDAWRNLTDTTRKMSSTMEKLSSGYRVNRASDDPAGLVISEQFRAQIAGLNRAVQNSEGSINMIQTAEGALNEINNLLVSMRELAIHAANEGFNDDDQLAADQAEITNAISTINRIAKNTQFGTKLLLDGSAANTAVITSANTSKVSLTESQLEDGVHSITAVQLTESTATMDSTSFGISNPTGPYNLTDGVHDMDVIQASAGAVKTGSAISALDAWGNGIEIDTDVGTDPELQSARVTGVDNWTGFAGNTAQHTITFQINYQEMGSNAVGMQTLTIQTDTVGGTTAMRTEIASKLNDAINSNTYLAGKVTASVDGANDTFTIKAVNTGTRYSLAIGGINATNTDIATVLSGHQNSNDRGVSGNYLKLTAQFASSSTLVDGESRTANMEIAANTYNSLSALVTAINDALDDVGTADAFGIYTGGQAKVFATLESAGGQSYIKLQTADEGSKFSLKVEDASGAATALHNVLGLSVDSIANTGTDAIIRFDGYNNTINDVRYFYTDSLYDQRTTLYDSADSTSRGSVTLDRAMAQTNGGINIGSMLLTVKARTYAVQLDGGNQTVVTAGKETTVWNSQQDQSIKVNYSLNSDGGTEQLFVTDRSLVFQIGANVGQTAKIGISNLAADNLGKNIAGNSFRNLSEIDVTTSDGAQDAQSIIDAAITEVTNIRGTMGSFQKNTLESNLTNLRIAAQNLTASEASIRDTDMAKTMSEFVKYQILNQAGTAMLAQANQIPQTVLSLFG
jgi:flagellin